MIALGVVLVAIAVVVIVGGTVHAMGWREAAGVWVASVALTACLVGGLLLIEAGLS